MSVIVEIEFAPASFELGRIFRMGEGQRAELESLVPLGESIFPFVWVHNGTREGFERAVREHPSVRHFESQDSSEDRTLYALDWEAADDQVVQAIRSHGGQVLEGSGTPTAWAFQLRFPDHDTLAAFQEHCLDRNIDFELQRVYNPIQPDAAAWYGLSVPQREALLLAMAEGYFEIPRQISTKELGAQLGISDQAVTERLRRGLSTLLTHTLEGREGNMTNFDVA